MLSHANWGKASLILDWVKKEVEKDIFKDLETRLKLRALLGRKKTEQLAKSINLNEKVDSLTIEKLLEKKKILEKLLGLKNKG